MKALGSGATLAALGLAGQASAATTSTIKPSAGFAEVAPWLEDDDVEVIRIQEATRAAVEDAVQTDGARVVVFETSGTIDLDGQELEISEDNCWVAGQTAPSPGITFIKGQLQVNADDCVVQHVRSRHGPGSDGSIQSNDSINTEDETANNVFDHVTASWGTDECLSVGYDTQNTTVTNCLVYEGLYDPYGDGSDHNYATLVGNGATNVTLAGNVWAKARARLPRLKGETQSVLANNLMYFFNESVNMDDDTEASIASNVFIPQDVDDTVVEGGNAHLEDNLLEYDETPLTGGTTELSSRPLWPAEFSPMPASDVEEYVLANAGARPADRTNNDQRIVEEIRDRAGSDAIDSPYDYWIPHPDEVGGYPELPENTHSLDVPDSGLRSWLTEWAAEVEEGDGSIDDTPTTTPSDLEVTETDIDSVSLSWGESTDQGDAGLSHYVVTVGDRDVTVEAGTTEATVDGLGSGSSYDASVVAVDNAYNQSDAATRSVETESPDEDRTGERGPITVEGAGADIWNESDESHFYYGEASGDFDVAVLVDSIEDTDEYAKAGIMARESLDADAANVMLRRQPDATSVQWRRSAGSRSESTTSSEGESESELSGGTTSAHWHRLVRAGEELRAYVSSDGVEWTLAADLTIDLGEHPVVGLSVTSHSEGTLCTAEFDSWSGLDLSENTDLGDVEEPGGVSEAEQTGPAPIDGAQPTDPDGDGLYEDISGDGTVNFPDVNTFFQHTDSATVQNDVQYYDFTDDGSVDLQDVLALFEMV